MMIMIMIINCLSFCKVSQDIKELKVQIKTIPSFPSRSLFLLRPPEGATKTTPVFGTFWETGKIGINTEEEKAPLPFAA